MIVKLTAPLMHYIWGGTKLKTQFNKQCSEPTVAESWELSFCSGSPSIIAEGPYAGKPITEVVTRSDWGVNCNKFDVFPTLIKLIDSQQNLSVQVHPSDDFAKQHENQLGKTEMWHIVDAQPGAIIYLGLNRDMTKQEFLQSVQNKTVCSYLNAVPVHSGETYFVPSGTFHAIGAGVTLLEIQQNSTLTYRVYDFDRVDYNGNPRQLHLEKAMAVANLQKYNVPSPKRDILLGSCEYFTSYRATGARSYKDAASYSSITVLSGSINIGNLSLQKGQTAFASAGEKVEITGNGTYVVTVVH